MLTTPLGRPTFTHTSAMRKAVYDVNSLGLHTHVLPTNIMRNNQERHCYSVPEIAGAIFQVSKYNGRFHGEIKPATPTGYKSIK